MTAAEDRPIETQDRMPGLGPAFARALVPSRADVARLPRQAVKVREHRQDRDRLAAYARVCGFTLRDAVPPTWIHVLAFPLHVHLLADPASTVRLAGAVHVSNTMTMLRPVSASESLDLTVRADGPRPHRRGSLVDLVASAAVAGETVWEGTSTYLSSAVRTPGEPASRERMAFDPGAPHGRWRLPADLGRRYRRVSGDPNPIHTSRLAARAFGFPRPIIHGMWTHARALAALDGRLPTPATIHVDFVKPIPLPGTVGFRTHDRGDSTDVAVTTRDGATPLLLMSVREGSP